MTMAESSVGMPPLPRRETARASLPAPYHSWERGLNENSNGLLRQYFPKGMRLDKVSKEEVFAAVEAMNHRPGKCLGFQTPWEVFTQLTQPNRSGLTSGALMS